MSADWIAFIALGSSRGDRADHLRRVASRFASGAVEGCSWIAGSRIYETRPVGAATQPFLNAAIEVGTRLSPETLLDRLLAIEAEHGRVRRVRWEDRSLDLDLVAGRTPHGPLQLETGQLTVPHPRATERDFVLAPLCELAPALPIGGRKVTDHLRALSAANRTILRVHDWLAPRAGQG